MTSTPPNPMPVPPSDESPNASNESNTSFAVHGDAAAGATVPRSPLAIHHMAQSKAWVAAVQPKMAVRIRYWMRQRLRLTQPKVDEYLHLPVGIKPSTDAINDHIAVACQAAVAGVSRTTMRPSALAAPIAPAPAGESLEDDLDIVCRLIWGVSEMRPMQREALLRLFSSVNVLKKLLIIQPTGRGKSLIIKMICSMLRGVHLIVHPLLVLTANQVASFQRCAQ